MRENPESLNKKEVIDIRNKQEYEIANVTNTIASNKEFIGKYPDASQVEDANININKLAYDDAEKINTIKAYQFFLTNYPKAKEFEQAKTNLRNWNMKKLFH